MNNVNEDIQTSATNTTTTTTKTYRKAYEAALQPSYACEGREALLENGKRPRANQVSSRRGSLSGGVFPSGQGKK